MEQDVLMELIASTRTARGFNQKDFAAKIPMPMGTYRNIEAGYSNLSVPQLSAMMKVLGISWDDLAFYFREQRKNGRLG